MLRWSSHTAREAVELVDHCRDWQTTLSALGLSSLLAIAWRFDSLHDALWAYLLYAAAPAISQAKRVLANLEIVKRCARSPAKVRSKLLSIIWGEHQ